MTWVITDQRAGFQPIATTSTTQAHALGTRVQARDDTNGGVGHFIYMTGVASTAIGSWAFLKYDDNTTLLADTDSSGTNKEGPLGVAMSANVASQYGWYQVQGKASALALTAFADNADVYLTSTAGSVDDTVVDGYMVHNATGASAVNESTLLADFEIDDPYVDGIAGND